MLSEPPITSHIVFRFKRTERLIYLRRNWRCWVYWAWKLTSIYFRIEQFKVYDIFPFILFRIRSWNLSRFSLYLYIIFLLEHKTKEVNILSGSKKVWKPLFYTSYATYPPGCSQQRAHIFLCSSFASPITAHIKSPNILLHLHSGLNSVQSCKKFWRRA